MMANASPSRGGNFFSESERLLLANYSGISLPSLLSYMSTPPIPMPE